MSRIRPPAVAGLFYPGDPETLRRYVVGMLTAAEVVPGPVRGLIAPHAGYVYSGPIAASAYRAIREDRLARLQRVVLIGTAHSPVRGVAATGFSAFETPLGTVSVDGDLVRRSLYYPFVTIDDPAHARDHALEVQLPFLQTILGAFRIVPYLIGPVAAEGLADMLGDLLAVDADGTLLVVSSDLSHYHPYREAQVLDRAAAAAIEALDPAGLSAELACGWRAIAGALVLARRQGWRCRLLDLRNSGDTAGPPDRVVGYGAFAFESADEPGS